MNRDKDSFSPARYSRVFSAAILLLLLMMCGCTGNKQAQSDASLKQQMTNPQKFDINNVAPDKREMVRAMMNSTKGGPPPATKK